MYRVRCPNCQAKIKVIERLFGRKVECKCGHVLRIPDKPGSPDSQHDPHRPIRFSCTSCNRKLQAARELAGKLTKCPCGKTMQVPTPVALIVKAETAETKAKSIETPIAPIPEVDPLGELMVDFGDPTPSSPFAGHHYASAQSATSPIARPPYSNGGAKKSGIQNPIGLAGFIVAILSFVLCWLPLPVALVLSVIGIFRKPNGLAIAGTVISGIGCALMLIGTLIALPFMMKFAAFERDTEAARAHINNFYLENGRLPGRPEYKEIVGSLADSIQYDDRPPNSFRLTHFGIDNEIGTQDDKVTFYVYRESTNRFELQRR